MEMNWLNAFGQMTYGIYVLTTRHAQEINGMIASWVSQVSYEPPLIMAAVHPNRYSHGLIEKSGHFALHVVDRSEDKILDRMMGPDPKEKFAGLEWEPGKTGSPILKDCMAWFECRIKEKHRPGNHTMFIGEVVHAGFVSSGRPLCTFDCKGTYLGND